MIEIIAIKSIGGYVEGKALVTNSEISFAFDVDKSGLITNSTHELFRKLVSGKVLVFPGTATEDEIDCAGIWALMTLIAKNKNPLGLIITNVQDSTCVQTALLSSAWLPKSATPIWKPVSEGIPVLIIKKEDAEKIKTDDLCQLDAKQGTIRIKNRWRKVLK
jgi:predicted aconitase with swiveling domain